MKSTELQKQLAKTQETIRVLQQELAETNRGLMALTMELEQRVDERTAELSAAHLELKKTNSELMQLTLELEDRVAQRTAELNAANKTLQQSHIAALNMMEDALLAREHAEQSTIVLQGEVTQRKRAEEDIRQMNQNLEQRVLDRTAQLEATNQELEAFSYSVSHDLRAPLRGIDGWAQALLADFGDKLGEAGLQLLHRQRAASQRMGTLIDDLLQLSRLTRQPLTRQTVAPAALVHRVWEELRPAQPPQNAELVVGALPDCQADPALLTQVFANLLGNALKFSGGHAHPRIEVGSQTGPDHECVYFVKDNGAGFDMRYASKLFGAFQRLHSAHEFPGTGIGLAITQRIIRRHGGRIWAESAVGQGAAFYFTLSEENVECRMKKAE